MSESLSNFENQRLIVISITEFAKKISIDNFRFLKQNVTDLDRTQMDIIAALPVDALLNVYRYLEPTTPISHQLVRLPQPNHRNSS